MSSQSLLQWEISLLSFDGSMKRDQFFDRFPVIRADMVTYARYDYTRTCAIVDFMSYDWIRSSIRSVHCISVHWHEPRNASRLSILFHKKAVKSFEIVIFGKNGGSAWKSITLMKIFEWARWEWWEERWAEAELGDRNLNGNVLLDDCAL